MRGQHTPKHSRKPQKQIAPIVAIPAEGDGHLREPQVCAAFSMSKSKLWRDVAAGMFPAPFKNGGITVWDLRELRAHMDRIRHQGVA